MYKQPYHLYAIAISLLCTPAIAGDVVIEERLQLNKRFIYNAPSYAPCPSEEWYDLSKYKLKAPVNHPYYKANESGGTHTLTIDLKRKKRIQETRYKTMVDGQCTEQAINPELIDEQSHYQAVIKLRAYELNLEDNQDMRQLTYPTTSQEGTISAFMQSKWTERAVKLSLQYPSKKKPTSDSLQIGDKKIQINYIN